MSECVCVCVWYESEGVREVTRREVMAEVSLKSGGRYVVEYLMSVNISFLTEMC